MSNAAVAMWRHFKLGPTRSLPEAELAEQAHPPGMQVCTLLQDSRDLGSAQCRGFRIQLQEVAQG